MGVGLGDGKCAIADKVQGVHMLTAMAYCNAVRTTRLPLPIYDRSRFAPHPKIPAKPAYSAKAAARAMMASEGCCPFLQSRVSVEP
jgi:hypothetical protein